MLAVLLQSLLPERSRRSFCLCVYRISASRGLIRSAQNRSGSRSKRKRNEKKPGPNLGEREGGIVSSLRVRTGPLREKGNFWRCPTFARPFGALSSALQRFTSVFGMGTGGAAALKSPEGWKAQQREGFSLSLPPARLRTTFVESHQSQRDCSLGKQQKKNRFFNSAARFSHKARRERERERESRIL